MSSRDDDHSCSTKSFFVTVDDQSFIESHLNVDSPRRDVMAWFDIQKQKIKDQLAVDFVKNPKWASIIQFGEQGDHIHLHILITFPRNVKLGSVSESFLRLYDDVVVKKVGNISNLAFYLLSEVGCIVAKSYSCMNVAGEDGMAQNSDAENEIPMLDLGEGKMNFRKIVCARLSQDPEVNTKKLKRDLMTKYPHMYSANAFEEIIANHRGMNTEEKIQERCSSASFEKLFHFLDM